VVVANQCVRHAGTPPWGMLLNVARFAHAYIGWPDDMATRQPSLVGSCGVIFSSSSWSACVNSRSL
jgi:hypothetical protein